MKCFFVKPQSGFSGCILRNKQRDALLCAGPTTFVVEGAVAPFVHEFGYRLILL